MNKKKTILAFGVIGLATALLALSLLNSYKFQWMDRMPLSICFWAMLALAYSLNGMRVGKVVRISQIAALALLAAGVVSIFAAFPGWLLQAIQVLCFVALGATCSSSIADSLKARKAKKAQPEAAPVDVEEEAPPVEEEAVE